MKTIAQLVQGLLGLVEGDFGKGSRKLEIGVVCVLICALAESWLGVAISGAGTVIALALVDAAEAKKAA